MIILPKELLPLKYNGYFWNPENETVYSIKIDGILKPLKKLGWFRYGKHKFPPGFNISHQGRKIRLNLEDLRKIKPLDEEFVIPYKK